eukprot:gene22732-28889_t
MRKPRIPGELPTRHRIPEVSESRDFGTDPNAHPYRGLPRSFRTTPGAIKFNITTVPIITGQGGTLLHLVFGPHLQYWL